MTRGSPDMFVTSREAPKPFPEARQAIDMSMHGELDRLRASAELAKVRNEYLAANPEVFQGFSRIILGYYTPNTPPTESPQYELAFGGLRDSLTTAASVRLSQAIERIVPPPQPLTPEATAKITAEVTRINQWLDSELLSIATTRTSRLGSAKIDPKIDIADIQYFGNALSPAVNLIQVFEKNRRDKPLVEAELRKYLTTRLQTASERASTYGAGDEEGKDRYLADFQREIGGMVTLFAGQPDAVIDSESFNRIFKEVQAGLETKTIAKSDEFKQMVSAVEQITADLFEPVGEDKDGKPILKAHQDIDKLQAGAEKYLNTHDTSGTTLGKNGSLYQIFYYYVLSNALILGAAGEVIMHGTFPGKTLAMLGATTALAMPDKVDKLLAPTPEHEQLVSGEALGEQAERYSPEVKKWALALDERCFESATKEGSLAKYLDTVRPKGLEGTTDLARFLSRKNTEKADDLGGDKQSGGDYEPLTFVDVRDRDKVMAEHSLQHLTNPKELQQLLSLLDNARQRGKKPSSFVEV